MSFLEDHGITNFEYPPQTKIVRRSGFGAKIALIHSYIVTIMLLEVLARRGGHRFLNKSGEKTVDYY
jgi:hypothetical protein